MKNVVFVTPSLKTGGGNRVFFELANILSSKYSVKVIYLNNSLETNTFSINPKVHLKAVGELANNKFQKLRNLKTAIEYINLHHLKDVVIITDPIFSIFTRFIKSIYLYRFIQADDYRIFDDGAILGKGILLKIYKRLCLFSYNRNVNFIFNSKYIYDVFCEDSKRRDIPFHLVHPAIDHDVFNVNYRGVTKSEKVTICLVARKHPWKGLITFLEAWNLLSLELKDKVYKITLISHDDLSNFDLGKMDIIKPSSDIDIAKAYCESDIFISTSWWEGFGLPPLEAMACGCSCIVSNSGGVNEYAISDRNCLMFKSREMEQLVERMTLLINDSLLRDKLSLFAQKDSFQFDWDKSAEQLLKIITRNISE